LAATACDVTAVVNDYCHSLLTITVMMLRDHQQGQGRQAGQAALGPVTIGCGSFNREWKRDGVSSKSGTACVPQWLHLGIPPGWTGNLCRIMKNLYILAKNKL
jgi:hypothetical protein